MASQYDEMLGKSAKRFKDLDDKLILPLASQATYTRPGRTEAFGGVPMKTVYGATIASVDKDDMRERCIRERKSVKADTVVLETAKSFSLDEIRALEREASAAVEAEGRETLAKRKSGPPTAGDMASMRKLQEILAKEPDHRLEGVIIRDFFEGGRTPATLHASAMYFKHNRPYAGLLEVNNQSAFSESGYRLHNHDSVG